MCFASVLKIFICLTAKIKNKSRYSFYLYAFSKLRFYTFFCIWYTSVRFRRSTAQRLVGIYSYTAYALQRAAPLQQNASILLGLGGY